MKAFAFLLIIAPFVTNVAAYVTNAVYVLGHFSASLTLETIVALVGILAVPLGVFHGVYIWIS
jgi:hypothetical protein